MARSDQVMGMKRARNPKIDLRGCIAKRRAPLEAQFISHSHIPFIALQASAIAFVFPSVANIGVDCVVAIDFVSDTCCKFWRDPRHVKGIAIADVEGIPRPMVVQFPIAREIEGIVSLRIAIVSFGGVVLGASPKPYPRVAEGVSVKTSALIL